MKSERKRDARDKVAKSHLDLHADHFSRGVENLAQLGFEWNFILTFDLNDGQCPSSIHLAEFFLVVKFFPLPFFMAVVGSPVD